MITKQYSFLINGFYSFKTKLKSGYMKSYLSSPLNDRGRRDLQKDCTL